MRGRRSPLPAPADVNVARTRKGDWAAVGTLLPYLWEYKGRVLAALACLVLAKVANVGVPVLLKSLAWLECELTRHLDVEGNCELYIGLVHDGGLLRVPEPTIEAPAVACTAAPANGTNGNHHNGNGHSNGHANGNGSAKPNGRSSGTARGTRRRAR